MQLTAKLKEFAGIRLEEGAPVGAEVSRQLDLRIVEEQSMRDQLGRVESDIASAMATAAGLAEQFEAAKKVAESMLVNDSTYMSRLHTYQAENASLKGRKAAHAEVVAECERKLPEYAANRLYAYLKARRYGSEEYSGFGFARLFDAWIARQCNFKVNRGNEQMLIVMRSEAFKRAGEGASVLQRDQSWLNDQVIAVGVASGASALGQELARQNEAVAHGKKRANDIHVTLAEYAEQLDVRFARAKGLLVDELKGHDTNTLVERAQQTESPHDDVLVGAIIELRTQLDRHDAKYAAKLEQRAVAETAYQSARA